MKNYKAILFDLDGTLLPMDYDEFTKGYFGAIAKKLSPLGMAPDDVVKAIWAGTKAMYKNDGSKLNSDVFWETFAAFSGKDVSAYRAESDLFYVNEFSAVKSFTGENPLAVEAVKTARAASPKVVLATNPLFPLSGQCARIGWVGLKKDDFDYITTYETESFCKPNPEYYKAVCRIIGENPEDCLMIGNDINEDMKAASSLGMDCYLVTDCIIGDINEWSGEKGTFSELVDKLKSLKN